MVSVWHHAAAHMHTWPEAADMRKAFALYFEYPGLPCVLFFGAHHSACCAITLRLSICALQETSSLAQKQQMWFLSSLKSLTRTLGERAMTCTIRIACLSLMLSVGLPSTSGILMIGPCPFLFMMWLGRTARRLSCGRECLTANLGPKVTSKYSSALGFPKG